MKITAEKRRSISSVVLCVQPSWNFAVPYAFIACTMEVIKGESTYRRKNDKGEEQRRTGMETEEDRRKREGRKLDGVVNHGRMSSSSSLSSSSPDDSDKDGTSSSVEGAPSSSSSTKSKGSARGDKGTCGGREGMTPFRKMDGGARHLLRMYGRGDEEEDADEGVSIARTRQKKGTNSELRMMYAAEQRSAQWSTMAGDVVCLFTWRMYRTRMNV